MTYGATVELGCGIAAASTCAAQAFADGVRGLQVATGQQQHQFLAAEARDQVQLAIHEAGADAREFAQAFVAMQVAAGIVERLETIGVDQQQCQRPAFARKPRPVGREALVEAAAIGDAGEAVAHRQLRELAVGDLEFAGHAREVDRAGDLVGDRIEHRADIGGEEIRVPALDVEHAVQALAMADRHQVFGTHRAVAGDVVGIVLDVDDQLRLARCARSGRRRLS